MPIPAPLEGDYRAATTLEIRSWSYGIVTSPRPKNSSVRDNAPNTLLDQRIFGPVNDFRCVCGKYAGVTHTGMICDQCGVKVAPSSVRGSRFGHVELSAPINHPFATSVQLDCFPVVPAMYFLSPGGKSLPPLYEQLVDASVGAKQIVALIADQLTPVVVTAHNWQIVAAQMLARGLALERAKQAEEPIEFCVQCGYLVAGLKIVVCPGCGAQLL